MAKAKKKVNKDLPTTKTVKAVKKAVSKMSSTKANTPGSTVKDSQRGFAKIAGQVAGVNEQNRQFATKPKKGMFKYSSDKVGNKMNQAEKKTLKSFKLK